MASVEGRYQERFLLGAFPQAVASGQVGQVKLWSSHQDRLSQGEQKHIGKTVRLEERSDGAYGAWQVLKTAKGDEALEIAREGELRGLSVGFIPAKGGTRRAADGVLERTVGHIDHVALTPTPTYAGAEVLVVRSPFRPLAAYQQEFARLRALGRLPLASGSSS